MNLHSNSNAKFVKLLKKQRVIKHQDERLKLANSVLCFGTRNENKCFFRMKKNLDNPDGYKHYWPGFEKGSERMLRSSNGGENQL